MKRVIYLTVLTASLATLISFQTKPAFDLKASVARGKETYVGYCISCHMEQGEGIEGVYPPVAKSDYMMADKNRTIQQILYGASGEMKVNGKVYNMNMTGFDLSDGEVSDLMNYIRNSFGNKGPAVLPEHVKALRKK
ncbi:MAG: cytochrome c [Bacteroidetes bacterium]|nr:cytochrome c [Bacteroidota bacterium]